MNKIIAIVGMAGAGKTEAASFFKERGATVLRFGSVIDEGLKTEGLPWTPENNTIYREKIRKNLGMAAVAIKMMPRINEALSIGVGSGSAQKKRKKIVLDGLYSWEEYLYLLDHMPIFLLCIYATSSIRYERLANRKERTWTKDEARKRDIDELEALNKGGPIALADYLIKNETTKEDFYKELENFWKIWIAND